MIEGWTPRRVSIPFWDNERVVLREPGRWEIRRWPSWDLVERGRGSLRVEWAGRRLAVIEPGGPVVVSGRPPFRLPAEVGVPRDLAWFGDGLVASTGDGPGSEPGRHAASGGIVEPALWWLPLEGPAVPFYTGPTGTTALSGVAALNGSVLCEALRSVGSTLPTRRLIIVGGGGESRDLAPELGGTCCGASVSNEGQIALSHGDFPLEELVTPMSFTLLVGQEGGPWRSLLPPEVRVGDGRRGRPPATASSSPHSRGSASGSSLSIRPRTDGSGWRWSGPPHTDRPQLPTRAVLSLPSVSLSTKREGSWPSGVGDIVCSRRFSATGHAPTAGGRFGCGRRRRDSWKGCWPRRRWGALLGRWWSTSTGAPKQRWLPARSTIWARGPAWASPFSPPTFGPAASLVGDP